MNKLIAFRTIGLSILLTTAGLFSASTAFAGGGGTGGGTKLEAAFKATGITLAKELALYPSQATALLKFQANDLLGAAYTASPTCATGQDLQYIKDQMKLAYVKGGNVILLNCYKDSPSELNLKPDWQDLLNSLVKETKLSIQSQILVAHELLRTINAEGENSYLSSGSIAAANFEVDRYNAKSMRDMLNNKNPLCHIEPSFAWRNDCGAFSPIFKMGASVKVRYLFQNNPNVPADGIEGEYCWANYKGTVDGFVRDLVDPMSKEPATRDLIQLAKNNGCF